MERVNLGKSKPLHFVPQSHLGYKNVLKKAHQKVNLCGIVVIF